MLTAVATNSLKIVIFNHLMLVDANCDDSVTIPRCQNLVVDLKVSVALNKNFCVTHAFWAPPYFKSWIHPCLGQKTMCLHPLELGNCSGMNSEVPSDAAGPTPTEKRACNI